MSHSTSRGWIARRNRLKTELLLLVVMGVALKKRDPQQLGGVAPQNGGKDLRSRRVLGSRGAAIERIGVFLLCASSRCWRPLPRRSMAGHQPSLQ